MTGTARVPPTPPDENIWDREQVVARLCALGHVVQTHLGYAHAADCFCGYNPLSDGVQGGAFRYSMAVLDFMDRAVRTAVSEGASPTLRDQVAGVPSPSAIDPRLQEIAARLKAATPGPWSTVAIPAEESELAIPCDGHTDDRPHICGERVEHVDLYRETVALVPVEGQHDPARGVNVFRADMAQRQQENVACLVHVTEDDPNVALIKHAPEDIAWPLGRLQGDV